MRDAEVVASATVDADGDADHESDRDTRARQAASGFFGQFGAGRSPV
jgi:hypothetical protein